MRFDRRFLVVSFTAHVLVLFVFSFLLKDERSSSHVPSVLKVQVSPVGTKSNVESIKKDPRGEISDRKKLPNDSHVGATVVTSRGEKVEIPTPHYPERSRRRGEEGDVVIALKEKQGSVVVEVLESSGYPQLDDSVLEVFHSLPPERLFEIMKHKQRESGQLQFSFRLTNAHLD